MAELYRKRWTIEIVFQDLEEHLHSEINTLGYPQAALFGLCLALVACHTLAVVFAALRSVHGEDAVDQDLSGYYRAYEIAEVSRGMLIAIPAEDWQLFVHLPSSQTVAVLRDLACKVRLRTFRKHPRPNARGIPSNRMSRQQNFSNRESYSRHTLERFSSGCVLMSLCWERRRPARFEERSRWSRSQDSAI